MITIGELRKKINIKGNIRFDESLSRHTTFRIGGPADLFLQPEEAAELPALLELLNREGVPCFVLGAGANILVSDRGIRGAVIDLSALRGCRSDGETLTCLAGTPVSALCEEALRQGLSGAEFLYAMPGSVGGAVWMNARCYSRSISDILTRAEYIDERGVLRTLVPNPGQFDYKISPFQKMKALILNASFTLAPGEEPAIAEAMRDHREDRERKGHFLYPCAGSVYKNNRQFGEPSGKIIDSLGLKGMSFGDAMVSQVHANIIVNIGQAKAQDVLALMEHIEKVVKERFGFQLEREILLAGDWG